MSNKLNDIFKVEVNFEDTCCNAAGGLAALTTGYVTEVVIDALLPELSGIRYIGAQVGKWVVAGCVASITSDYVVKEAHALAEIQRESRRLTEKIMNGELLDDDDYDIF